MDLRDILLIPMRLEALDQPSMLLGEVVVHQEPHRPGANMTRLVLGHGLEGLPDAGFLGFAYAIKLHGTFVV